MRITLAYDLAYRDVKGKGSSLPLCSRKYNWDSSRANFLSKTGQNLNIYKGFLSKAGQNSNSQTGNHTPLQEHAHVC